MAYEDLPGKTIRYWKVLSRVNAPGKARFWCECVCGLRREVDARSMIRKKSPSGSCGCMKGIIISKERADHGNARHGPYGGHSRTWNSWEAMLARCTNRKHRYWKNYGGSGVKVCDRWKTFENFLDDMGARPADRTLDRWPDPGGNYEPGNCRWATKLEQRHNRRLMSNRG